MFDIPSSLSDWHHYSYFKYKGTASRGKGYQLAQHQMVSDCLNGVSLEACLSYGPMEKG